MAAPVYSTDLQDIATADNVPAETWNEPTGSVAGAVPAPGDTENLIQGVGGVSKACAVAGGGLCGMGFAAAAPKTIASPNAIFSWIFFASPGALQTEANGGLQIIAGNTAANYKRFYIRGKDTYAYSGWICVPVDPNTTAQATYGSPSGVWQYFGGVASTTVTISKGSPFAMDVIRFGRTLQCVGGDLANGYATFVGAAEKNDMNVVGNYNRWGLLQDIGGSYLQQGLFLMGTATTAVDFRDANRTISIADTKRVTAAFNAFEVRNASSRVDWANCNFTALGTTSRGNLIVTDNATVNLTTCVFTGMGTFAFQSNSTILTSTFRRCDMVTTGGATFTGCTFDGSYGVAAVRTTSISVVTGCEFVSAGTGHAVEATVAGSYNSNNTYTGYATNSGTAENRAFHNSSGGHIDLTITGGDTPSVRNSGGSTTNVIVPEVTLTVSSQVSLAGAEIRVYDMDGALPSLGTELAGVESNVGASFSFSTSAGNQVWLQIMLDGYKEFGQQLTMPATNGSFIALLRVETNA